MPGINDAPEQVEEIVALATEAGAVHIGGITLWLRGSVKGIFFDYLREHRPELVKRYERLYARGGGARRGQGGGETGRAGLAVLNNRRRPVKRARAACERHHRRAMNLKPG